MIQKNMKAVDFDSFYCSCPYFVSDTIAMGGYGCRHPNQEKEYTDSKGHNVGECFCSNCPCGFSAEQEDRNNMDIDWSDYEYDNEVAEDEYIIIDRRTENKHTNMAVRQYFQCI